MESCKGSNKPLRFRVLVFGLRRKGIIHIGTHCTKACSPPSIYGKGVINSSEVLVWMLVLN